MGSLSEKLYFSIGEVSELAELKPHVLRYWEEEFTQLKPIRRHGRRYYQKKDLHLVHQIKRLLYSQGFTIEGAKLKLKQSRYDVVKELKSILALLSES